MGTKTSETKTQDWVKHNAIPFTDQMVHDWLTNYLVAEGDQWVGHTATLMITGASGAGKTRMLSTVARAIQNFMGGRAAAWKLDIPHNGMKQITVVEPASDSKYTDFVAILFDLDVFGKSVNEKWIVDADDMRANLEYALHRIDSLLRTGTTQLVLVASGTSDNFWELALTESVLWPSGPKTGIGPFPPMFWYLLPSPDLFKASNRAKAEDSLWMDIPSSWRVGWFANSELSYGACLAMLVAKAMRAKEQYSKYLPKDLRVDPEYKIVFVRKDGDVAHGWHRDETGTEKGGANG